MKKIFVVAVLLFCVKLSFSQFYSRNEEGSPYQVTFNQLQNTTYQLQFSLNKVSLSEINTAQGIFTKISFASSTATTEKGWAELPFVSRSIQLPPDKDVDLVVTATEYEDVILSAPLLPSRGVFTRNQNPDEIPYTIAPESKVNRFYPNDVAQAISPFVIRDVRGTSVRFYPFQYNAVTNTLRIYTSITVELRQNNHPATNPVTMTSHKAIREMIGTYKSIFMNYTPSRADLMYAEMGDILVVTTAAYEEAMQPYILWKRQMGYNVSTEIVASGTSATEATNLLRSAYEANSGLLYVQIAGEFDDIKSPITSNSGDSGPSDVQLGCISGNDDFPDVIVGRFVCSNASELTVQIDKAINYEKNPILTDNWRETFIGIGSDEGGPSYGADDNEYDYDHVKNIYNERLRGFTYNTHRQNYANEGNVTASTIASCINQGASTIAYCGHGSETSWGTSNFSTSNINSLSNGNMLPFIVSVACDNGKFNYSSDCFAEKWLKKANGGAVVTLMSGITQPWSPPQRGQDYFYDILVGGFNYDDYSSQSGINTHEQRTRWGSIVLNMFNLMLTESNDNDDVITVRTWNTFGDASLQLRTKKPEEVSSSNMQPMMGIPFTTTITSNGEPVNNALVCLSQNDEIFFSGMTNELGEVTIIHDLVAGPALLVVTAFNTTTIVAETECAAANAPYVLLHSYTPVAVNHGETISLSLTMKNMGTVATPANTIVTLNSSDEFVTSVTGVANLGTIMPDGGMATADDAFQITISDDVVTGQYVRISYTAVCDTFQWTGQFRLQTRGADCEMPSGLFVYADGNHAVLSWDDDSGYDSLIYFDNIEGHTAFTINSAGPIGWSAIDADASSTYSFSDLQFTHEGNPMAYIVMNTAQATGSMISAYSGQQFLAFPRNASSWFLTPQNDDWLISPELNYSEPFTFSFFARSFSSQYASEKFHICYSTTGRNASDFVNLTSSMVTTSTSWTKYSYTIPAEAKYVAIHCLSNKQYMFCVDDITLSGVVFHGHHYNLYRNDELIAEHFVGGSFIDSTLADGEYCYALSSECVANMETSRSTSCISIGTVGLNEQNMQQLHVYPNPATAQVMIEGTDVQSIDIYNALGARMTHIQPISDRTTVNVSKWSKGMYLISVTMYNGTTSVQKLLIY